MSNLGQYFTTNIELKEKVYSFILNSPNEILEPSIGQGDLVTFVKEKKQDIKFDMYEIDTKIKLLPTIIKKEVVYGDFLKQKIDKLYKTIIGNPPYVRTTTGNLYIDFIKKCYNLLDKEGELIFIIPSDFFKLTSASKLLDKMMSEGSFTHIYHPHKENLFTNASIDVIIFRYCKNKELDKVILYNDEQKKIINTKGLITFNIINDDNKELLGDYFNISVGLVSGKDDVYKNNEFGNIEVLTGKNRVEKFIFLDKLPVEDTDLKKYMISHKDELLNRGIRKFNENNWYEWGAPRNKKTMEEYKDKDCIYISNLTRKSEVAFVGKVGYFGGGLIMLIPKKECDINKITNYLNTEEFKKDFIFSGRFKIGHRQLVNSYFKLNDTADV